MIRVANIAEAPPEWRWIAPAFPNDRPDVDWRFFNGVKRPGLESLPGLHWGRIRAAIQMRNSIAGGWGDQIVSHGPYTSFYASALLSSQRRRLPHLAMSFNFTDLPPPRRFAMMKRGFRNIDKFIIYSRMEQDLYSDLFDIPVDKFQFLHWAVKPPLLSPLPRTIPERYFVTMGGEARDYDTLLAAARLLPHIKFVFIVRPWSLIGKDMPHNVEVFVNLPWEEAWSYVWHAEAALLPLRSSRTPNGHVTIVGGMHIGKAHIATRSIGISDYAKDGETALLVDERSPEAFVTAIERMMDEPDLAPRLGSSARDFAQRYCTEQVTAEYFRDYLIEAHGL